MRFGPRLLYLFPLFSIGVSVILDQRSGSDFAEEDPRTFSEAFGTCLSKKSYGTIECANRGALSVLQTMNEKAELDFGEIRLSRSSGQARDLLDFDYDPKDFGNVVKAAARLMEGRSLKWDLDGIYPGLKMQVGPTLDRNGVLEFVVNDRGPAFADRGAGNGRLLTRNLILPLLLGVKFSLASLVPLIFGLLLVVSKKALILAKVAILLSGFLGWSSFFTGSQDQHQPQTFPGHPGYPGFGFGSNIPETSYADHGFNYRPFREVQPSDFAPYDQHVIRDVVNVYGADHEDSRNAERGKNFAWQSADPSERASKMLGDFGKLLVLGQLVCLLGPALGRMDYIKIFERCTEEKNTFDCLKQRAVDVLDSAIKDDSVYVINDFVAIGRDPNSLLKPLAEDPDNATGRSIDEELDRKFHEYLASRSIRLTIPGDTFEGRKKKDKGMGGALMMGGLALAGMMAQLAFGKIALLAGTALVTAKIALVISAIIGLKKLVHGGGGGHEVIYATASEHHGGGYGGGGGGWQRSLDAVPTT
ncbi:uncharacterized protein LOC105703593 [Orussus abietinus]|uniref:uncharacterized protein LOC105703593 n=1 Tax=Orussus abietinus TaxID=222816 RepID=UPI000625B40A|nr:uncharacterized protein LOC105703593 [Orussus abietinus]